MVEGKCSKRYPWALIPETITGDDGYPLYHRRSTADNGRSTIVKVNQQDIEVDNRWIVPCSRLLSKTFNAHINVEFCQSVKSIKYICKYVTKGSDMAVIGWCGEFQRWSHSISNGTPCSSNEAIWRIFSFAIHERHPTVIHLSVHLENGQRVYYTAENALQRASRPPSTTLTSFFWNVPEWWLRPEAAILRNAKILYLESTTIFKKKAAITENLKSINLFALSASSVPVKYEHWPNAPLEHEQFRITFDLSTVPTQYLFKIQSCNYTIDLVGSTY